MNYKIINDKFNGVAVLEREDGKFGIQETIEGEVQEPEFRYRTQYQAEKIASEISKQHDRVDAHVAAHS